VAAGRFSIHAVRHVDEAIEVLTGLPAGDAIAPDPDSVSGRIAARLHQYARLVHGAGRHFARRPVAAHAHVSHSDEHDEPSP
jgi:hypothetical protein